MPIPIACRFLLMREEFRRCQNRKGHLSLFESYRDVPEHLTGRFLCLQEPLQYLKVRRSFGLTGCRSDRRRKELLLEDRSFLLSKKRKHLMSCLAAAERFCPNSAEVVQTADVCGCNCVKLFPGRSGCVDGILYSCISGA